MIFDYGFVKIPRRWWNTLATAPPAWVKVWLYVAINANIRPGMFFGRTINPGQIAFSVANLARQCGVSVDQTRAALEAIQKANAGTIETTNKYSVLTLLDWDDYKVSTEPEPQTENQAQPQALAQTNPKQEPNDLKKREERTENTREWALGEVAPKAPLTQKRFVPPTEAEVRAYASEIGYAIDAERFCAYHGSRGWVVGRAAMKNWKMAVVTWRANERSSPATASAGKKTAAQLIIEKYEREEQEEARRHAN